MKGRKYLVVGCSMLLAVFEALNCAFAEDDPQIGDKPLSELLQQLRSRNRGEQMRAAQALSAAPTNLQARIIPQVIPVLKSERENDKFVAAQVLGVYGPASRVAVPDLLPMLKGTQYERNRAAAAKALGQILKDATPDEEVEKVTQALIEAFGDGYDDVRREAVQALGMIGPAAKSSIKRLAPMITEFVPGVGDGPHLLVRRAAAWTCGRMGPLAAEHVDLLIAQMNKELWRNPEVVEALGRIGPVNDNVVQNIMNVIEMPQDGMRGVMEAYVALEQFGPKSAPAVPLLCRFLKEGIVPPAIIIQSVKVLKAVGPAAAEAVPVLTSLKSGSDKVGDYYMSPLRYITAGQIVELKKCCVEAIEAIAGKK